VEPYDQLWKYLKDLQFLRTLNCMYMTFILQPECSTVDQYTQINSCIIKRNT